MENKDIEQKIDAIFDRGVIAEILPNKEAFIEKLKKGEKIHIYIGIDPTAPNIHLGHAQNLMLLEDFRQLGAKITLLVGDFTAQIGDPTGKDKKRKEITEHEIKQNCKEWRKQFVPFINLSFSSGVSVKYNSSWLQKMNLKDFMHISRHITVGNLIERSMFQNRISEGKSIHLTEFLYPVLQGYDSLALDVDAELCGTDQTFNALIGRDILKQEKNKEKFVISTNLIEDEKTGQLMSKSNGTGVFVDYSKNAHINMFGQIMSLPDGMMRKMFLGLTRMPVSEINNILSKHPLDAKKRLAFDITARVYGSTEAQEAETAFVTQFQKQEVPKNIETYTIEKDTNIADVLVRFGVAPSKGEVKRKITEGAVSVNGEKIDSHDTIIQTKKENIIKYGRQIIKVI